MGFGLEFGCVITRVPVQTLFEYLETGDPLDEFLEDFPKVSREHAVAVLKCWITARLGGFVQRCLIPFPSPDKEICEWTIRRRFIAAVTDHGAYPHAHNRREQSSAEAVDGSLQRTVLFIEAELTKQIAAGRENSWPEIP